ncbi:hypothetical protein [Synechococcus elongatus]|uniref:hypothetical protein n=1 Tax=Synechococcus elongatus TaxID=32046 RepID=UPI0030CCCE69
MSLRFRLADLRQPRLYLICESDRPSWDLYVVLSRQTATGLWDFSQGFRRVKVEAGAGYWVDLQPTCQRLSAGDRLCLSVALAAYPALPSIQAMAICQPQQCP